MPVNVNGKIKKLSAARREEREKEEGRVGACVFA